MQQNNLIEITNDVLEIVAQIKSIDNNYKLFYNAQKSRFELYSQKGMNLCLELVCPYEKLDNRFLLKVKQSRREYMQKLIEKVERENEKLIADTQSRLIDETSVKAKEMIDYGNKKVNDVDFIDAYTTEWF